MNRLLFWLIIAFIFQNGCKDYSQEPKDLEHLESIIMIDDLIRFDRQDWQDGHYSVIAASITDDVLKLSVEMMEAVDNTINLVCWNYFLESNPVQAYALLSYQGHDSAKKVEIERELLFDLTPMKEAYIQSYYGWGAGNIIILRFRDTTHPQSNNVWVQYEF
jgi:hypothetical protein